MGNGNSIGLGSATLIAWVLGAVAVLVWRLAVGDTPADAQVYVTGILGTVSAVALGAFRIYQNVRVGIKQPPS